MAATHAPPSAITKANAGSCCNGWLFMAIANSSWFGSNKPKWQSRFFLLTKDKKQLEYYHEEESVEPEGVIELANGLFSS